SGTSAPRCASGTHSAAARFSCGSASTARTDAPDAARRRARAAVSVVLPTPPLPVMTTRVMAPSPPCANERRLRRADRLGVDERQAQALALRLQVAPDDHRRLLRI